MMQYTLYPLFVAGNVESGYNRTIDFLKKRDFPKKAGAFDRNIDVLGTFKSHENHESGTADVQPAARS
jgi:hypothetical protein